MEILLDIRDQHLDSMEIRPEDQLNLFKALRCYKENMGKLERILETRKKNNCQTQEKAGPMGNQDVTQTTPSSSKSTNLYSGNGQADGNNTKNSFTTINLNIDPVDSKGAYFPTDSFQGSGHGKIPKSKNNKITLKPMESLDDFGLNSLAIGGKKIGPVTGSSGNSKTSTGRETPNDNKRANNSKFVIKRPSSRDANLGNMTQAVIERNGILTANSNNPNGGNLEGNSRKPTG
jgi:hypothetical protein